MSRTAIIFVEYKKSTESKWNLFAPLIPKNQIQYSYPEPLSEDIIINGTPYAYAFLDEKQGIIRDLLDDNDISFNRRGFPPNLSEQLNEYLNRIDLEGCWGKSYVDFAELYTCLADKESWAKSKISKYSSKKDYEVINAKLDALLANVKYEENKITDEHEDILLEYEEYLDNIQWIYRYIHSIQDMIQFCTNSISDYHYRLIYFMC